MTSTVRRLRLWQDKIETEVEIAGSGPALVYLHGPYGLAPDLDFVERLARSFTVYAPKHPGTTKGDPDGIHQIEGWLDLVHYHRELFDRLGLVAPILVGHSVGGMVAAELAAFPNWVRKLILIDPVGLWRDDKPVKNWMVLSDARRPAALFADPESENAKSFFALPQDPEARVDVQVNLVWSQACTGKFSWPIPDRGLSRRIHRIATPTLILWGKKDAIIDVAYAEEFTRRIDRAQAELLDDAGHFAHHDQPDRALRAIETFLAA